MLSVSRTLLTSLSVGFCFVFVDLHRQYFWHRLAFVFGDQPRTNDVYVVRTVGKGTMVHNLDEGLVLKDVQPKKKVI